MDTAAHTIERPLRRSARLFREIGPRALAIRILRRLTRSQLQVGSLTFFARRADLEAEVRSAPGFTVRELRATDRQAILFGSESGWETLQPRFAAGDLCFGALDEQGRAVHTRWVTFTGTNVPELGMDFVPAPNAAYFYDGYTRPDARRQGIDAAVRAAIFQAMRSHGRNRVYSYVRNDNPEGLRAASRCQETVARVRYARLFSRAPLVFGSRSIGAASLVRAREQVADDARSRAAAWRAWFEGWLEKPLAERSIGFHQLPEEAFEAMARHIGGTLDLDAAKDVVLDVGCDSALVTRHVAKRCKRLVGVDFIPGMLIDAQRSRPRDEGVATAPRFAAADGRALPFADRTFTKAYCSGVVHTLPTVEDGFAMILEIVRVLEPGGRALIAAIPDRHKVRAARREAWRLGGITERARLVAALMLPTAVRRFVRGLLPGDKALRYLTYDLPALSQRLEARGLACAIVHYPPDFWSRDFERTRSNLAIDVPGPLSPG